jgi:hypothetical protein
MSESTQMTNPQGGIRLTLVAGGLILAVAGCSQGGSVLIVPDAGPAAADAATTVDAGATSPADASGVAPPDAGTEAGTGPEVLSLSVSPLVLSPPFSPSVHDYVVRCAAGSNQLDVEVQVSAGATVAARTPTTSSSAQPTKFTMAVDEDDAVIVQAVGSHPGQEYWVRCLPHDFPRIVVTPHTSAGAPTPGWYLTGNSSVGSDEGGYAMVLDTSGTPVWYEYTSAMVGASNVDRRPDGSISYIMDTGAFGTDPTAAYTVQKLSPWQTSSIHAVEGPTDAHELQTLPNGDVLLFTYPIVSGVDLTGLSTFGANENVADCIIEELDFTGALVWHWQASDHIDPVKESLIPLVSTLNGMTVVDPYHFNAVDVDASGNLLLSARDLSALYYIDKTTSQVVWKLGGTAYSKDGAQLIRVVNDSEVTFSAQHDGRFQGSSAVSMFDDHNNGVGPARGVEYAIDFSAGTATPDWQYATAKAQSQATGSFRRYADGSNVICWGVAPTNPVTFTEVTNAGQDVLDVAIGTGDFAYRTVKVAESAFDHDTLRLTAGHR